MIFDFHFSTMDDDLYGQVESKSSLGKKTRQFGSKMVKLEAFENHHFYTRKRVFLFICAQLFSSIVHSK